MDTSIPAPPPQPPLVDLGQPQSSGTIAPWWHTVLLLLLMVGISLSGAKHIQSMSHHQRMAEYVVTIVMQWLLVLYVFWGLRLGRRLTLRELIGGRWQNPEAFLIDVAIAIGFRVVSTAVLAILALAFGGLHLGSASELKSRLEVLYPDGLSEQLLFQLLCLTAGFCEEVMYRGYLQRQFTGVLKSVWAAITLQAVIFGASHAYQSAQGMLLVGVLGFLFGALAQWRRSLRPGMIAHFSQDSIAGLLGRWFLKNGDKLLPKH